MVYLAAIRLGHLEQGYKDPSQTNHSWTTCVRASSGIKVTRHQTQVRLPLTTALLADLRIAKNHSSSSALWDKLAMWAALTLWFYGFLVLMNSPQTTAATI